MFRPLRPSKDYAPKEQVADQTPMKIGALSFGISSESDIRDQSSTEISDRHMYDAGAGRTTTKHGPLDRALGNVSKTDECDTCGQDQRACNGHWGYIKLYAPCYHVGFLSFTLEALNQVCKTCSKLLLEDTVRRNYLKLLRRTALDPQQRKLILKRIQGECRKKYVCPHCSASNGPVRKVPGHACKVVHLKFEHFNKSTAKSKKAPKDKEAFDTGFGTYLEDNPEMDRHVRKAVDDVLAVKAHSILARVSTEDCELMGIDTAKGRPESYLWTCLPVPPNNIRPSVPGEASTTEDELTAKLSQIIDLNSRFKAAHNSEEHPVIWMDLYEKLQDHIAMYINSHAPGLNKTEYGKAIRSFCTRLKGKQGRFRGNLSGKRVNFSGRTVIGPDPNLSIEEVGMPIHVAKILTYPERVTTLNIDVLKEKIALGSSKWPGANLVHKKGGRSISVRVMEVLGPKMHKKVSQDLAIGDVVDRHVINGDIVLFNRQPSLHKLSILCHRVRVHPGRTFRFNESVCNPYNADFDGDEMNIHVPQTEEARTEAIELMGVKYNLVTPKNGAPIIAPIQDFITAAYLLSSKDRFYTRLEFSQIMGFMFDGDAIQDPLTNTHNGYELPPPTVLKPQFLWTGKQIFNVMMRPNKASKVMVNAEAPSRQFKKVAGEAGDLSDVDAYLVVRNSQIMCGVLDKSIIGDGKKCSIFYGMLRDYGEDYAVMGMNRMAKLSARWIGTQGFSIGIGDVYPTVHLTRRKKDLIDEAKRSTHDLIVKYTRKELGRDAGCNEETTLENKISSILSGVRAAAGNVCFDELMRHNSAVIMAKSGSKGSLINVSQMVASVGQQMINSARVQDGFQDRSLPHFRKGAREPAAKGFVENSFFTGLTPSEFIFHAMSGREGLVDTAVKTAETGYMSRRLIKSLEDNSIAYDDTVRTSSGSLVQFRFGDDSIDPAEMEGTGPVDFNRTWVHALETTYEVGKPGLKPDGVQNIAKRVLLDYRRANSRSGVVIESDDDELNEDQATRKFLGEVAGFLAKKVDRLRSLDVRYNEDGHHSQTVDSVLKITERSLREFLTQTLYKFRKSHVQPGHAVGAIAAQSIGEPGTQMTLKTFHFAGVAGMSITQGVPRIKEIINAAKRISTPIITCDIDNNTSIQAAQIIKGRIEKTYLRDVASSIEDVHGLFGGSVRIKINAARIVQLQLEIGMDDIIKAISKSRLLKLGKDDVQQCGKHHIVIRPEEPKFEGAMEIDGYFEDDVAAMKAKPGVKPRGRQVQTGFQATARGKNKKQPPAHSVRLNDLKRAILDVVVGGYPETTRAIIKRSEKPNKDGKEEMQLLVEGYGLKSVMATPGVVGTNCRCNNVMETQNVLGIEAARTVIIQEMDQVMGSMDIDSHHIALMACTMTCKGEVLGITRFGMSKFKDSVLQLASFEKTPDHLFEAATRFKSDRIEGVSESIIMGQPVRLGTGIARVLRPLGLGTVEAKGVFRKKEGLFTQGYYKNVEGEGWRGMDWGKVGRETEVGA